MNDLTEQVLNDKIVEQEAQIAFLSQKLKEAEDARADTVLRRLRVHGAVLLHVGPDYDAYQTAVRSDGLGGVADAIANETWSLDHAPVSSNVISALRVAADNGMNRW